jgi:hypothetical protein
MGHPGNGTDVILRCDCMGHPGNGTDVILRWGIQWILSGCLGVWVSGCLVSGIKRLPFL